MNNLLEAELKTLVIRMLKELSEDLNSIKKTQAETLMEIKSNLQGINSGVDEAKNQNNDMEHREIKLTSQNNKKKESKKQG